MPEELQGSWLLVDEFLLWEAERALSKLLRQINQNLGGAALGAGASVAGDGDGDGDRKVVVEFPELSDAELAVHAPGVPPAPGALSPSRPQAGGTESEVNLDNAIFVKSL